jgi:C4-type Zn-finger protein
MDDETYEPMDGVTPPKIKHFSSIEELLGKLEGRATMWERVARENKERAEEFEGAAQQVRNGATSVTVGRTTYVLGE